jgi:hypothetical protein
MVYIAKVGCERNSTPIHHLTALVDDVNVGEFFSRGCWKKKSPFLSKLQVFPTQHGFDPKCPIHSDSHQDK